MRNADSWENENMKLKSIAGITMAAMLLFAPAVNAMDLNSKAVIQAVQKALNESGFDCGTPDGISGPKTESAIKEYQASKGLEANGQISEGLLTSMGFSMDDDSGVSIDTFITRYNESVTYFNGVSAESGDQSVNQISYSNISQSENTIDEVSLISFGLNLMGTNISSCNIQDKDASFDVKNLYELCSIAYGLDSTYSDPDDTLTSLTTLFDDGTLNRSAFACTTLNVGGKVVFSFKCNDETSRKVDINIPDGMKKAQEE